MLYNQQKEFYIPENFDNWFFPIGKDLNKPFENFRILKSEVIDYLSIVFAQEGFVEFINIMNKRNPFNMKSIRDFAKQSKLNNQILNTDLKEIDELSEALFIESVYRLWNNVDVFLIQKYLKEIYKNCETFSLEFNVNSKVTDKNKKDLFRDVSSLSLGQKVVAMLDFILGYSEFTNDNRPLLIDQPEDNLDSRYIYNNLVQILRNVKSKRQIIIATHNATLVTNTMSDLVVLMESDGEHGWVESYGYPSEDKIKKHIVNYLEGGKESFEHKVKMYERVIDIK
ncbi:TPA: AAA family ATPase [Streptococcus pyogenes]|nr:AAA family ATPase [Streptococcus pyogenes]